MKKVVICATAFLCAFLAACSDEKGSIYYTTTETTTEATIPHVELESPDVRNVMWGMTGPEIAVQETEGSLTSCEDGFRVWNVSLAGYDDWDVTYVLTDGKLTSVEYNTSYANSRERPFILFRKVRRNYPRKLRYSCNCRLRHGKIQLRQVRGQHRFRRAP